MKNNPEFYGFKLHDLTKSAHCCCPDRGNIYQKNEADRSMPFSLRISLALMTAITTTCCVAAPSQAASLVLSEAELTLINPASFVVDNP